MARLATTLLLLAMSASGWPFAAAQNEPDAPVVEIIGTSPLPGQGVDRNLLPYATQVFKRAAIEQASPENLTDLMSRRIVGAQINDVQGSPFQADLTFRGFRASGLLGASQGLSVYLDGVRVNEPFGDVVNWDLIPEFSLDSLTLVPGANPAFGLNTLGGAISLTTASGVTAPGVRADLTLGSFGRRRLDFSFGGSDGDGWHHYVGGTWFGEQGWRDHSEGRLGLVLAKWGHTGERSGWDLSVLGGRSTLIGNGLVPAYTLAEEGGDGPAGRTPDLYAADRSAIYTHPDRTRNELLQAALNLRYALDQGTELSSLLYLRGTRRGTVNGDTAEEPDAPLPASLNATATRQTAWGLAASIAGRRGAHQWQVGASFDASRTRFRQSEQPGDFTPSRGVVAADCASGCAAELSAAVAGHAASLGLYGTDTWQLAATTHLTATLRVNHARVGNRLTTRDDDSGEIETQPRERFRYRSVNPALGLTHGLGRGVTVFGNIARNSRVPTVIELGCADPDQPCRLPAGLQSDPFLKQVTSTTAEAGARWQPGADQRLSLSLYRTRNRDDILFGSVSATGQLGYFQNFPGTRHQGWDAEWQAKHGPLTLQASYSRLDATYDARGTLRIGERNVAVAPGMHIAGLPRHTVKLGADWRAAASLSFGGDWQWVSRRGVLGNEDGQTADDPAQREDLSLPGHAVLNLRASWQMSPGWELIARLNNALDRRYETYGALAETVFDAGGRWIGEGRDALFVAPGTPRSVFFGLRWRY